MNKFTTNLPLWAAMSQLSQGQLYVARASIGAVAAKFSTLQLINPAASGRYAIVRKVRGSAATAGAVQFSSKNAAITTAVTVTKLRLNAGLAAVCTPKSDQIAALDTALFEAAAATTIGDLTPYDPLVWLDEGQGFAVELETANIAAVFEIWWSEVFI